MASAWSDWRRTRKQQQIRRTVIPREKTERLEQRVQDASADAQPLMSRPITKDCLHSRMHKLPSYDRATGTRNTCLAGLLFSWLISIACITLAHWTFNSVQSYRTPTGGYSHNGQGERVFFLSTVCQELVKLAVNICISFCTDCLGYIHSVSTRWALWRERRLLYNSNARLLVSTPRCSSSRWSTNLVSGFLLMVSYASSGQLFLSTNSTEEEGFVLNGVAISALGIGLLGQAMISMICIWNSRRLIPTWSSNPLNTTLVCLHRGTQGVKRRCMLGIHQADMAPVPSKPVIHQYSARRAIPWIRHITRFLWIFVALTVIWAITIRLNPYFRSSDKSSSRSLPLYGESMPVLQLNLCALLITTSLQLFLTISLHLTELLVNLSRDEHLWRRAMSKQGTQMSFGMLGSLKSAICSWQTILLFILKSLAYWLFGLAVNYDGGGLYMNWAGIFVSFAGVTVVAMFGSFLAWRQPAGPQPATFGHIQTLANLVDEWFQEDEKIWWGDKGVPSPCPSDNRGIIRHAGTARHRLQPVDVNSAYQ